MLGKYLQNKWRNEVRLPNINLMDYVEFDRVKNGHLQWLFKDNLPQAIEAFGVKYEIKAGFKWDGASSPRPLWLFFSPFDEKTWFSTLIHDFRFSIRMGGFFRTNWILFKMIVVEGGGLLRAFSYLVATSSPIGYYLWRRHKEHESYVRQHFT